MKTYEVRLDVFEGPLDLLLHLIKELEIDINDIPMAVLTRQYMDYIEQMKELEINIASEYLVMASELLKIKSFMLLPEPVHFEEDFEDPREKLMEQLLEYQNFKTYAKELEKLKAEQDKIFIKAPHEFSETEEDRVSSLDINDLISAYQKVKQRVTLNMPKTVTVRREVISREEAENYINNKFSHKHKIHFTDIFSFNESKPMIVAIFVTILEMVKRKDIGINLHDDGDYEFERIQ